MLFESLSFLGDFFISKFYYTFVYIKQPHMGKIIFNVPDDIKDEFKTTCDALGMNMTSVLISSMITFSEKARKKPKNKK